MDEMAELNSALKKKSLSFGKDVTLKRLRLGKAKKVFLASNCPSELKKTIGRYAEISKAEIINLSMPNDEIGLACKKQFSISVFCY